MPYFIDEKNCVRRGTKAEPGAVVKCHEEHAEAVAHLRALYANVEDAEDKSVTVTVDDVTVSVTKGGAGSGWHRPPKGTHNAENAPNFRGGPGADRTYGTESDEPPEGSKLCKCTKCNSTFTLPRGKQCEDVKCPGCGGSATQTSPRRDRPAEGEEGRSGAGGKKQVDCPACEEESKAMDGPGPQVHGEGGSLGQATVGLGDGECTCPHCDGKMPCTAKNCPHCDEAIDAGAKALTIYKSGDTWHWMTLSSWAVVDKEFEVVSEQAYRDAIDYAQKNDAWGEMDLVHVDGTDVGDCDKLFILKREGEPAKLGACGTWYDTPKAVKARQVIQAEPDYWGVSLKFRFNPDRLIKGVYTGDIQVLKHSILPQRMAASYGTAIAVQQGGNMSKQLDEQAAEALRRLEYSEEEIAELAEKQKALPQEENVVEKEDTTTQDAPTLLEKLYRSMGKALGIEQEVAPDASTPDEARKAEEVEEAPAQETEPAAATEKQATGDEPKPEPAQPGDAGVIVKALSETIVPVLGQMVQEQLEERDKRITDLEHLVQALGADIETQVEKRLADMPPITKVSASSVVAPAEAPALAVGPMSGQAWKSAMMEGIGKAVDDLVSGKKFQA